VRHLELRPARTVRLRYEFSNRQPSATGVWLALCPTAPGQSVTRSEVALSGGRGRVDSQTLEGNELLHVSLDAGGTVRLEATVETAERVLVDGPGPSPPARGFPRAFLRATAMVPLEGEIAASARRILAVRETGDDAVGRARAFFDELVEGDYRYVYPPAERGAAAMLRDRRGDCGEFSSLFAAWCRSVGIPARIVYGTWARGRMSAHAWNEFWLEGVGWVPVDASLGWAMQHRPWNWLGQGLPMRPEAYFARLDGARIGFSYGPDVEPVPPFEPPGVDGDGWRLRVAGRELRWGLEALDGRLPYLQPAYPRFTSPPVRRQDLLGRWRVSELGAVGALGRVRRVALVVALVAVAVSFAVDFAFIVVAVAAVVLAGAAIGVGVLRRRRTAAG
jgi:transglutaminase-like putative cysteine protease